MKKKIFEREKISLLGAAHRWGWVKSSTPSLPPLKLYYISPAIMKLGTVMPYIKNIQKIYKSRSALLNQHDYNFDDVSKIGYSSYL